MATTEQMLKQQLDDVTKDSLAASALRNQRIAELENAIAQHKLKQWGGEGVEVSSDVDAALYAHLQN